MTLTRRQILQGMGIGSAALMLPRRAFSAPPPLLLGSPQAGALWANRFGTAVAIPPVALPVADSRFPGADYYEMAARQFTQQFSPYLDPTTLWGYTIEPPNAAPLGRQGYLGGIIIAQKGRPVKLRVQNLLTSDGTAGGTPLSHPVRAPGSSLDAVDDTIDESPILFGFQGGALHNRIAVHLHGGLVRWQDDGHPSSWYSNDPAGTGNYGQYYQVANDQIYTYPNNQSARLEWYHDHAMGLTRLNAYAGLATGYLIRDQAEADLVAQHKLPPFIETSALAGTEIQEYPLILQEKMFNLDGSLYYHCFYDPAKWALVNTGTPPPYPSCVAEFFGDVSLVNGVPWPNLAVKKGIYRFRLLNAAQARFYNLRLLYTKVGADGKDVADTTRPGPRFYQIGTEGGFLPAPVWAQKIVLGPAERADVLVDFSGLNVGDKLILIGDAPAPYPAGDPANDYIDTVTGVSMPGTLMEFQVIAGALPSDAATALPTVLPAIPKLGLPNKVVPMTLNEGIDQYGRLAQLIGSFTPTNLSLGGFGAPFVGPPGAAGAGLPIVYETHRNGDIEEWTIVNNTGDVHPMHFHLVNVQIVSRQGIDLAQFNLNSSIRYVGPAMGPDANERGWKETVRCYPGQVTRVRMKFDAGYTGHYVWHCHILEHEEHDMMHEFEVV